MNVNIYIADELEKKVIEKINRNKVDINSYILELIEKDISSRVYFDNNFSFDYVTKKLYSNDKEVTLKPMEYKVFKLLLDNKNEIVGFERFQLIWRNESISSRLRIHIKNLRDLTYPKFIINHSKVGYRLIC